MPLLHGSILYLLPMCGYCRVMCEYRLRGSRKYGCWWRVEVWQSVECIREVRGGVIHTLPCMVKPYQFELR